MNRLKQFGTRQLLPCTASVADLIGCNPKVVRFSYCSAVLMKHWTMECNHGCQDEIVESGSSWKWHDVRQIDSVAAILIKNW
ncbi:MAG: hypothetical protein IPI44_09610 [Sulfuritalea sp.]|nr:hypothetical protein [Sulfuritalea sp.]